MRYDSAAPMNEEKPSSRGHFIRSSLVTLAGLCAMAPASLVGTAAGCGTGATTVGTIPVPPAPEDGGDPDGGADTGPPDAGCTPGAVVTEDCGNCGKRTNRCNALSVFAPGACTGEPASACKPGTVEYSAAGCAAPSTFRSRTCGAACAFGSYSATCEPR